MSAAGATLREQLERLIHGTPGRGLSLDFLCEQLPDIGREAVRNSLKYLVKLGVVMRHGTIRYPLYQSLLPNGSLGTSLEVQTAASVPASISRQQAGAAAAVRWPDDVKVQRLPTPRRAGGQWMGVDWSQSLQRPGCQDHLAIPSRRGDQLVQHRPAAGMRTSNGMRGSSHRI